MPHPVRLVTVTFESKRRAGFCPRASCIQHGRRLVLGACDTVNHFFGGNGRPSLSFYGGWTRKFSINCEKSDRLNRRAALKSGLYRGRSYRSGSLGIRIFPSP